MSDTETIGFGLAPVLREGTIVCADIRARHERLEGFTESLSPQMVSERKSKSHLDRGVLLKLVEDLKAERDVLLEDRGVLIGMREDLRAERGVLLAKLNSALGRAGLAEAKLENARDRETALLMELNERMVAIDERAKELLMEFSERSESDGS